MDKKIIASFLILLVALIPAGNADEKTYHPERVVYDVTSPQAKELDHILDRASLLQRIYDNDPFASSIIIVLHEGAIPLFAKTSKSYKEKLVQRARSLAVGEIIQFRLCAASAKMQGFTAGDFHKFIKIIPMADAEIIQLQRQGFAYLR